MTIYPLNLSDDHNLPLNIAPNVLTIGNFDGVHRGHQAMLKQLHDSASTLNISATVMLFEPQPREYFAKLKGDTSLAPARLTTADEKIALLVYYGIHNVIIAYFDEVFRSLSAKEFADLLANKLNVKALVLGDDFRFGHDRTGDSEFLRHYGLPVSNLHTITDTVVTDTMATDKVADKVFNNSAIDQNSTDSISDTDTRISSTRIRECLAMGDIKTATHLLGHDYSMTGEVLHGDKIGRTLDFPTANIALNRVKPPLHGIFGVDVVLLDESGQVIQNGFQHVQGLTAQDLSDDKNNTNGVKGLRPHSLFGAANIGTRPSVDKPHDWRLEVHFPDFAGNLYGKVLNVRFLHYLHGERHYDGLEKLKMGIKQDVIDLLAWRHRQI